MFQESFGPFFLCILASVLNNYLQEMPEPVAAIKIDVCIWSSNKCPVPVGSLGSGPAARLSAKARHHSAAMQKLDGHLARQGDDTNDTERCVCMCARLY